MREGLYQRCSMRTKRILQCTDGKLQSNKSSVLRSSRNRKHDSKGSASNVHKVLFFSGAEAGRWLLHSGRVHCMDSLPSVVPQPGTRLP